MRFKKTNKKIKIIIPAVLIVLLLAALLGYYLLQKPEDNANKNSDNKVYSSNDIMEYGPLVINGTTPMPTYNSHSVAEHISPSEREDLNIELENIDKKMKEIENEYGFDRGEEIAIPSARSEEYNEYLDLLDRKSDIEYKLFKANVGAVGLTIENSSDETVFIKGQYAIKDTDNKVIESYSLQPSGSTENNSGVFMEKLISSESLSGEEIRPGEEKTGYLFHNQTDVEDIILELDFIEGYDPIDIKLYEINLGL